MRYVIQLLNYDSEWVDYARSSSEWYTERVIEDLHRHGFADYQISIVTL